MGEDAANTDVADVMMRLVAVVEEVGRRIPDLVTGVGAGIDAAVFADLSALLPSVVDVPIVGEESSREVRDVGTAWVVDSVDGTYNLLTGDPVFAVSVALVREDEAIAAVVHRPSPPAVTFSAGRGLGAWIGDRRLRLHGAGPDPAVAAFGLGEGVAAEPGLAGRLLAGLIGAGFVTRQRGAASLDVCAVAAGRWVGFVQLDLRIWDVLAADLVARESGAVTSGVSLAGWDTPFAYHAAHPAIVSRLVRVMAATM